MGFQPKGKDNEGQMAWFAPGRRLHSALGDAPGERTQQPGKPIPGTFRFAHGLGAGDLNGDGRKDVICPGGWWQQPKDAPTATESVDVPSRRARRRLRGHDRL